MDGVVKGYHEWMVTVTTGETLILEKKIGSYGEAFQVVNKANLLSIIFFSAIEIKGF